MQAIISPAGVGTAVPMDVSALAFVLANTEPDVWAPILPGESWADVLARRDAARDILDELLAEAAGQETPSGSWIKSSFSGTHPEGNCVEARVVRPVPGRADCAFCGGDGTDGAGHACMVCGGRS